MSVSAQSDFTALAQVGQHRVNTVLVDHAQAGVGYAQTDPAVFALDPEATILQLRQEAALRFVIGVGYVVPHHRTFARYLADSRHGSCSRKVSKTESPRL
jgi:hypothetical protein